MYIDGVLTAVPKANKGLYLEHAHKAGEVFKEYGALSLVENWGDDIPDGELTSMPMAVKCELDETVVLSWISWPSKAVRDAAWQKIMQDQRMSPEHNPCRLTENV